MEINFNVHGQQRKKLVEQIANYTQQKLNISTHQPTHTRLANTLSVKMGTFHPLMRFHPT